MLNLEGKYLFSEFLLSLFELVDLLLQLGSALFGLELLPHSEGHRTLVQSFIGRNCHFEFVANAHQKKASLGAVDGHLTDDLVEALVMELLADGADSGIPTSMPANTLPAGCPAADPAASAGL